MSSKISNSDLVPMINRLNAAMERLQLPAQFDLEMGSRVKGQAYVLVEERPGTGPMRCWIGGSPSAANSWLEGMLRALQTVSRYRELAQDRDGRTRVPVTFDPDAKSVRRGAEEEESFPFHQRADFIPST